MTRIRATADLHGALPEIEPCDLLLVGGDVCPIDDHDLTHQWDFLDGPFRKWLASVPAEYIVGIAGNHDFLFEDSPKDVEDLDLPWTYLQDTYVDVEHLTIYGTPWIPNLVNWAFHDDDPKAWQSVEHVDIMLSHGPPANFGDLTGKKFGNRHVGSANLNAIIHHTKPDVVVCGHIHEGYGEYRHSNHETTIYNVAHMDENYNPVNPPVEIKS